MVPVEFKASSSGAPPLEGGVTLCLKSLPVPLPMDTMSAGECHSACQPRIMRLLQEPRIQSPLWDLMSGIKWNRLHLGGVS